MLLTTRLYYQSGGLVRRATKIIVPSDSELPPGKELVIRDEDAYLNSNILAIGGQGQF